jgi:hypothetical protein
MLPHSYVKTVLSVTSSLQKHSPLLPSSVWSAVQVGVCNRGPGCLCGTLPCILQYMHSVTTAYTASSPKAHA